MVSPYVLAESGTVEVETKVPFEFHVGKNLYPAGTYFVTRRTDSDTLQMLRDDRKHLVPLLVITRLAKRGSDAPKASVVFDVVNKQHFISEVWIAGSDGYQVGTLTQAHKHELVEVRE